MDFLLVSVANNITVVFMGIHFAFLNSRLLVMRNTWILRSTKIKASIGDGLEWFDTV